MKPLKPLLAVASPGQQVPSVKEELETLRAQNAALSSALQTLLKTLLAFQVRLDAFTNLMAASFPEQINDASLQAEVARVTALVEAGIAADVAKENPTT